MSTPKATIHLLNVEHPLSHSHRLLGLPEIMDLAAEDDVVYSLQVWSTAFRIISDFVMDEFSDKDLSTDVLQICQEGFRRRVSAPRKKQTKRNVRPRKQRMPAIEGGLKQD